MVSPLITRSTSAESALAKHMSQVFNYMAGGVGVSGLVAWLATTNPFLMQVAAKGGIVWMLLLLGVSFFLNRIIFSLQPAAALGVFVGFSALMGFSLAPLVAMYTGSSVATAFGIAAIMFVGVSLYGYTTQKSLSGWGTFLMMGVFGIVGASLVGLVLSLFGVGVGPLNMVINLIAVPLFAALTAYEVNSIKETFATYGGDDLLRSRLAILQATGLYISFINMFISLLQLIGDRR